MIALELSAELQRLVADREPFVLATVVHARKPTSVRPGDAAVVHRDGSIQGFVGGVCAESSVRLHSLRALETGEPLLLRLVPDDEAGPTTSDDGAIVEHNPCLSGGALEIFLEPHLPAARVVIVGGSPIAQALERVAAAAGYDSLRATAPESDQLAGAGAVIVASHGTSEEGVLAAALGAGVPYVALVASRRRGEAVRAELDVDPELRVQLHTPAGLDIGARTPAEIAISILAQLVSEHHADPAPGRPGVSEAPAPAATAVDPVCGMTVAVSPATLSLQVGADTAYFCGTGCRDQYARTAPR